MSYIISHIHTTNTNTMHKTQKTQIYTIRQHALTILNNIQKNTLLINIIGGDGDGGGGRGVGGRISGGGRGMEGIG